MGFSIYSKVTINIPNKKEVVLKYVKYYSDRIKLNQQFRFL